MKKIIAIVVLLQILVQKNYSQCLTANAGPDKIICAGNSTTIGTPAQPGLAYRWSPATGLSNPNIAQPLCSPTSTTTYTLTTTSNLLQNGNFEQGNTGFLSDYLLHPLALQQNKYGRYLVNSNPNSIQNGWCNIANHTTGGSLMFVADCSLIPADRMWYQTVAVTNNTVYNFSGWAYSLTNYGNVAPILNIQINGQAIIANLTINYSNCTGGWIFFNATWNSQNNSNALIEIRSQTTAGDGCDIALDDLTFGINCPTTTDDVLVTVVPNSGTPTISPKGPITYYNQYETTQTIPLTASSSANYQWYKNGQIIPGATNQVLNITCNGLVTYTDYYYVVTTCGTSNSVTFSYIGCNTASCYPVALPSLPICSSQSPVTVYSPSLGAGSINTWWTYYTTSCFSFRPIRGATSEKSLFINFPACTLLSEGIYTKSSLNGRETYIYYTVYASTSCRVINPFTPFLKPKGKTSLSFLNDSLSITPPKTGLGSKSIFIAPNPANQRATINSKSIVKTVEIFSITGVSLSRVDFKGSKSVSLDTQDLKPGSYSCKVTTNEGIEYLKLIIAR
jgi:Secretion system C-terminal sorting domain